MKKVSLLSMAAALILGGNLMAQEPQVLISEQFEEYTVGNKIAVEAVAAGHDWWTTWSNAPGGSEDGVVANFDNTKCGYLVYGNDQVLLLGDEQSGIYDLEFDILVPNGKNAYFNILHDFAGSASTWALESYLHMSGSNQHSPGTGIIHAGGTNAATFTCVYDAWMHFRLHVDTDNDVAEYYYTAPGESEVMIHSWQWSLNSQGNAQVGRKLAAMDFFPPQNAANSEYYLDNFSFTKVSGDTYASLVFDTEAVNLWIAEDDAKSYDINISNENGTSIGDWTAWIDFGQSQGGTNVNQINYDLDPGMTDGSNISLVGINIEAPTLVEVGAMFPGAAYAGSVMGTKIVSAQYTFFEGQDSGMGIEPNTPVTFRVYGQGMNGQPGEVLAEKVVPYNQVIANDWTIATFDTPVDLTGFNVWVTVEFTQAVSGYPMNFDGSGNASEHGDYYRTNGGGAFNKCSDVFSTNYGDFHIRMNCQGAPVSATWASLSKPEGSMPIGGEDMVTVNLNSFGLVDGDVKTADIVFKTNDPENAEVIIPLTLNVSTTNVGENNSQIASIYPNPATSMVTLEGENLSSVAIYNVAGQLVRIVKLNNVVNNIDMNVESGVYFFNVYDNNGNSNVLRVVITK
jgi:hypothetical protein